MNRTPQSWFRWILLPCLLLTLIGSARAELPDLGDAISGMISSEKEYELGRAWLRSLRRQLPVMDDPLVQGYVRDLTYRLAPNSELNDRRLEFVIIDSNALNAFAVPGGIIGVNAGLFLNAESEQEFASVLAHELAHLSQRHFARRLEQSQRNAPLTMAGLLASVIIAATAGGDAGVATLAAAQAYSIQSQLAYSRQNEQEADRIGIATLAASSMNPRAMADMFERMLRNSRYSQHIPEYLRTHPLTESRVADARNRAEQFPARAFRDDLEFYLMKSRIILHYADSPDSARNLFGTLNQNLNSMVGQAARYGQAIAATQAGELDDADALLKPLLEKDPNRISYIIAKADILVAQEQFDAAAKLLQKHLNRNPGNASLSRSYASVLNRLGQSQQAEPILQQLTLDYPNDPALWRQLADTHGLAGNIVAVHQAQAEFLYLNGNIEAAILQLHQALKKSEGNYQQTALIQKRLDDFFAAKKGIQF